MTIISFRTYLVFFFIITWNPNANASVNIEVAPEFSQVHSQNSLTIQANSYSHIFLNTVGNDFYTAFINVHGATLTASLFDQRKIEVGNYGSPLQTQILSGSSRINIPTEGMVLGQQLFLVNQNPFPVTFNSTIYRIGIREVNDSAPLREGIKNSIETLNNFIDLPDIKIFVKPCFDVNAYSETSTPNIIICTELVARLLKANLLDAVYPILYHEIAHKILYQWQLPGYDNEDTADEFAAVFTSVTNRENLKAWLDHLKTYDSVTQALFQLYMGDKHAPSIQRERNILWAASHSDDLMKRWRILLGTHIKAAKNLPTEENHLKTPSTNISPTQPSQQVDLFLDKQILSFIGLGLALGIVFVLIKIFL